MLRQHILFGCAILMIAWTPLFGLDLKNAVVVTPQNSTLQEKTAITVLVEEVQKRTQMKLAVQNAMPASGTPAIVVGTSAKLAGIAGASLGRMAAAPRGDEGFRVQAVDGNVVVAGNDAR